VHRRADYVLFNKMISTRGQNQEYTNNDNAKANRLSQGHLFTWLDGSEYQDIAGAWDWYLIPGSTVLLNYPIINSSWVGQTGKKDFVGVISDGTNGFSVMDYVDPHDGSLTYRRAWFYIGDLVVNTIVNATRQAGSAPVVTVLDQRLSLGPDGGFAIDGGSASSGTASALTMRYGSNGYFAYSTPFNLTTSDTMHTGDWGAIGTSTVGTNSKIIFTAYHTIPQGGSFSYGHLPASKADTLASQSASPNVHPIASNAVSGVVGQGYVALVFWPGSATATTFQSEWSIVPMSVAVSAPVIVLASRAGDAILVRVADPTQKLSSVTVMLSGPSFGCAQTGGCTVTNDTVMLLVDLPTGGTAGSSVLSTLSIDGA
jgi:hypothetical protein